MNLQAFNGFLDVLLDPDKPESNTKTHAQCKSCNNSLMWDSSNLFIHLGGCLSTRDAMILLLEQISSKTSKKFVALSKRIRRRIAKIDEAHQKLNQSLGKRNVLLKFFVFVPSLKIFLHSRV